MSPGREPHPGDHGGPEQVRGQVQPQAQGVRQDGREAAELQEQRREQEGGGEEEETLMVRQSIINYVVFMRNL